MKRYLISLVFVREGGQCGTGRETEDNGVVENAIFIAFCH